MSNQPIQKNSPTLATEKGAPSNEAASTEKKTDPKAGQNNDKLSAEKPHLAAQKSAEKSSN